eukprot:230278-Chlamydomonas_euryale.AAC.13
MSRATGTGDAKTADGEHGACLGCCVTLPGLDVCVASTAVASPPPLLRQVEVVSWVFSLTYKHGVFGLAAAAPSGSDANRSFESGVVMRAEAKSDPAERGAHGRMSAHAFGEVRSERDA